MCLLITLGLLASATRIKAPMTNPANNPIMNFFNLSVVMSFLSCQFGGRIMWDDNSLWHPTACRSALHDLASKKETRREIR